MTDSFEFQHLRATGGTLDDFRDLLDRLTPRDLDKQGAVVLAARMENEELITLLANHGCDIDGRCSSGRTGLDVAAAQGSVALVELFLQLGANPSAPKLRLLFHAAANRQGNGLAMAKLLVEAGVNVNETFNAWGGAQLSSLDAAAAFPELAEYLRSVGAKTADEILGSQP